MGSVCHSQNTSAKGAVELVEVYLVLELGPIVGKAKGREKQDEK